MKKITILDRIVLLAMVLLAAYQIVAGIDGMGALEVWAYTIAFGVLVVAGLLLIILGFEVLDSPVVVVIATLIPVGLSAGLVARFLPTLSAIYVAFALVGLAAIALTRLAAPGAPATAALAIVHTVAGLVIFVLPIVVSLRGDTAGWFALVGVGGGLIGLGGLLLAFLKAGRPILPRETILAVFPGLLLMTTAAFVAGFMLG